MEPIINPWVFYAIDVLNGVASASRFLCIPLFLGVAHAVSVVYCNRGFSKEERLARKMAWWIITRGIVLFSIFLMIAILIPRQETMYKMLVATYITPDNIGAVQSNVVEFIGRVAEQLVKLKK